MGCSRQAVAKRAKDWTKATDAALQVAEQLEITKTIDGHQFGKRSPENIARLLNAMALTRNEELSCNAIGIDPATLYRWKKKDAGFASMVRVARARKVVDWVECIDRAATTDWKAADRLLKIAPETKDSFGEHHDKGPTFVLNIVREAVVIEGEAV